MSIENNIKRIADALEALVGHLTTDKQPGADAAAKTPAPPAAEDKTPAPPAKEAPEPPVTVTLADLNTAMVAKAGEMGDNGNAIFAMLKADHSATGLNQLQPEVYAVVLAKVNALGA